MKSFIVSLVLFLSLGVGNVFASGMNITEPLHITLTEGMYTIRGTINIEAMASLPQVPLSLVLFGDDSPALSQPYVHSYTVHDINDDIDSAGNYHINMTVGTIDPSGLYYFVVLVDDSSLSAMGGEFNPYTQASQFSVMLFDSSGSVVNIVPITNEESTGVTPGNTPPCPDPVTTPCADENDGFNPNFTLSTTITNPLGTDFNIANFLDKLFTNFVKIVLPFLVLFMVYSGFLFVEARGNEEKLAVAKKNFLYVIIGAAVVFGAWTIAHVLKGTVEQFEQAMNVLRLLV